MRYLALVLALAAPARAVEFSIPEAPKLSQSIAGLAVPASASFGAPAYLTGLPGDPAPAPPGGAEIPQSPTAAAALGKASAATSGQEGDPAASIAATFDGAGLSKFERKFLAPLAPGGEVDLASIDPSDTDGWTEKKALKKLAKDQFKTNKRQKVLYADGRRRLLIVLQGMDTSGKDGIVRHVLGPINPQGISVASFKKPTAEEAVHHFLWRIRNALSRFVKGIIGVFNRSHYEDILVPTVINALPAEKVKEFFGDPIRIPQEEIEKRYDQINAFEKELTDQGWTIIKFFLYISRDEQKTRLEARRDTPKKQYKLSPMDIKMRPLWPYFREVYGRILARTNTPWARWYIIPANNKWYARFVIGRIVKKTLKRMDVRYPGLDPALKGVQIPD